VQTVEYLKAENRMLRSKLPRCIDVTPAERDKLLKLGVRLGAKGKEVISFVHPRTFARWLSESKSGAKPRKRGRPRKTEPRSFDADDRSNGIGDVDGRWCFVLNTRGTSTFDSDCGMAVIERDHGPEGTKLDSPGQRPAEADRPSICCSHKVQRIVTSLLLTLHASPDAARRSGPS
jgi:hypothetical protein